MSSSVVHRAKRVGNGLLTDCGVSSTSVWRCRFRVSFTRWKNVTCTRCLRKKVFKV